MRYGRSWCRSSGSRDLATPRGRRSLRSGGALPSRSPGTFSASPVGFPVVPTWDRRTPDQQAKVRDAAIRRQLRDAVGPFSPFWRERFSALRVPAASISGAADLTKLPAVGERDVCPSGDPAEAARLVLQANEAGF